jgi:isocitrate dehydrogenase
MMKEWPENSSSRVAHMTKGDFYGSEQSVTVDRTREVRIEHVADDGSTTALREKLPLLAGKSLTPRS